MHALIIATGSCPDIEPLNQQYPNAMLPLIDRPFLQHLVELLVERGIHHIDFVLSHLPDQIEQHLGDGTRWGGTFRFHLTRDPLHPYGLLPMLCQNHRTPMLLGHADCLPPLQTVWSIPEAAFHTPMLFGWRPAAHRDTPLAWTGWGWITPVQLTTLPAHCDFVMLQNYLTRLAQCQGQFIEVPQPLSMQSYDSLMTSHWQVLTKKFSGLMFAGQEVEENIWLAQNVSLHPTAYIRPPVYVGQNCRIGAGTQLGPYVVVGNNCILDNGTHIEHAVIFPGTYIGTDLDLTHAIVDRTTLIDTQTKAIVPVTDVSILASVSVQPLHRWLAHALERLLALGMFLSSAPLLLCIILWLKCTRQGPIYQSIDVVQLPTSVPNTTWHTYRLWRFRPATYDETAYSRPCCNLRHLLLVLLPALIHIVRGQLHFVGVPPRTVGEIEVLPVHWQTLYLQSQPGIITEADVYYGTQATEDERYLAEAFYSINAGLRHDLKLALRYLARILRLLSPPRPYDPAHDMHDTGQAS